MLFGTRTPDGALYITESAPTAGDPANGGVSMTNDGSVHVDGLLPPQVFANGFGFRNNGALCINKLGTAIAGYHQGLPFNSAGQLVCQLNQPVSPGDAFVGGIRVGPLGGIYIVDGTPPVPNGFSSGFSQGFGNGP